MSRVRQSAGTAVLQTHKGAPLFLVNRQRARCRVRSTERSRTASDQPRNVGYADD